MLLLNMCVPIWKKKKFKIKLKKNTWSYYFTYMCTKNYDQMMYSFWDMVQDICDCYFSFWAIFCPFTSLTAQKIKIKNKKLEKLPGDIIILHMCTKNYDQMMYSSWDISTDIIVISHFGPYFVLLPLPLMILNIKILKKRKKCLEILSS